MIPNFFIVGAARSGTTTAFEALRSHPGIFMPAVKEPQYFSYNPDRPGFHPGGDPHGTASIWTKDRSEYESYFEGRDEAVIGEASTSYLYSPDAPYRIAEQQPDAQIFIQLRHPVDRAYSHYLRLVRDGRESASFREAIENEGDRIKEGWEWIYHYKKVGFYGRQVERYYDAFGKEQVQIVRYDRLDATPDEVLKDYLNCLGFSGKRDLSVQLYNVSGNVWSEAVAKWLSRKGEARDSFLSLPPSAYPDWLVDTGKWCIRSLRSLNRRSTKRSLEPELFQQLLDDFRPQIKKLDTITDQDFTDWLQRDNLY